MNIFTDEHGPSCKPGELQMVERRNTAGSIYQIMTVIKLTEDQQHSQRDRRYHLKGSMDQDAGCQNRRYQK